MIRGTQFPVAWEDGAPLLTAHNPVANFTVTRATISNQVDGHDFPSMSKTNGLVLHHDRIGVTLEPTRGYCEMGIGGCEFILVSTVLLFVVLGMYLHCRLFIPAMQIVHDRVRPKLDDTSQSGKMWVEQSFYALD